MLYPERRDMLFRESLVPFAPADLHYGLRSEFMADKCLEKVNLVIGAYRDDRGQPWVLPTVAQAIQLYHDDALQNQEYLPIAGEQSFCKAAAHLLLGCEDSDMQNRKFSFQTISGTGAVHLGAVFLSKFLAVPKPLVYLSDPTWDNHVPVFTHAGLSVKHYQYYSTETRLLNFEGMIQDLQDAPRGSIIVLQASAHNPTGVDPSQSQWEQIAETMKSSGHFAFFDCAYQGFATGDLMQDSFAVRHFFQQGIEMFIAQSFSKNLGLYGQRTGCLHYVANPGSEASSTVQRVASQLSSLQRSEISTPPLYGAKIASLVLNDKTLSKDWLGDLATMSERIAKMRAELQGRLEELGTPGNWRHITTQIGMFAYTGLNESEVELLRTKWHVYMLPSGRMSVAGLNSRNVSYVADAIHDVVGKVKVRK
ncbi:aspartate transaminase [Emericellopsis atlantica]|uniref:aspartate transaminase n=1 Tax=Emericellopsis atlantica TaxID=2614577 RepID=A0A9P7ZIY7_9HYPO|nr:aspartate transaminase [Emericellopsis atlantica]KAG9252363.1 aspartate transaminase [Emericellopsis atlantica]